MTDLTIEEQREELFRKDKAATREREYRRLCARVRVTELVEISKSRPKPEHGECPECGGKLENQEYGEHLGNSRHYWCTECPYEYARYSEWGRA